MAKLFDMADRIKEAGLNVILVQIDEAHSDAWPINIDKLLAIEQPKPQKTFKDRVDRANQFISKYRPPYPVYIDGWDNTFSELFRAWPDKYHCINKDLIVVAKSEYHTDGKKEAVIMEDYTVLLEKLAINNDCK